MSGLLRLVASERLKLSKSLILLLVPLSPLLSMAIGMLVNFDSIGNSTDEGNFAVMVSAMAVFHSMLFMPIFTGILSAFVCRYEHSGGGWKQVLALPVSRTGLYLAKFSVVASFLAVTQLLFLAAIVAAAAYHGIAGTISWGTLLLSTLVGLLACLPLAALQLLVSVGWSSFAAPLAINVALTIPNLLIVNSERFGPYYPWAQPMLATLSVTEQSFSGSPPQLEQLLLTVLGSFVFFIVVGLIYFNRKEI